MSDRRISIPKMVNKYGIVTIYVKPKDEHLWLKAGEKASALRMSRSQYILSLIEKDLR